MEPQRPFVPFALTAEESERMLFVTGIPRSGTSLMAHLLDQLPNIVILNEPLQVPQLFEDASLETFFSAYVTWRTRIANGEAVENQCVGNAVVSDTWPDGERRLYVPTVTQDDFVLGTKNPLAYLTRLQTIRRVFPGAHILILVRHPYYTIGSWKRTFPHLRDATIRESAVFKFADEWQRRHLGELAVIEDSSIRRASLWKYLATQITACAEPDMVIRYEDLIVNPSQYLRQTYERFFSNTGINAVPPLMTRNEIYRDTIDENEKFCIRSICGDSAAGFGYTDL